MPTQIHPTLTFMSSRVSFVHPWSLPNSQHSPLVVFPSTAYKAPFSTVKARQQGGSFLIHCNLISQWTKDT